MVKIYNLSPPQCMEFNIKISAQPLFKIHNFFQFKQNKDGDFHFLFSIDHQFCSANNVPNFSLALALKSGPACKLALNQVKQHLVMSLITRSGQSSCGQVRQSIDGLFESYFLLQNLKIQFMIQNSLSLLLVLWFSRHLARGEVCGIVPPCTLLSRTERYLNQSNFHVFDSLFPGW